MFSVWLVNREKGATELLDDVNKEKVGFITMSVLSVLACLVFIGSYSSYLVMLTCYQLNQH